MRLPEGWYLIGESKEVPEGKPVFMKRFGRDLCLFRDHEKLSILHDRCPHRSASLAGGTLLDGCVVCPFHGFRFDSEGSCTLVPETKKAAPNLRAESVVCLERHGFIFAFHGEDVTGEPPWFAEIDDGFAHSTLVSTWRTHITRCVENQLDYAHLPFVHRNTIGGGTDPSRPVFFELESDSIKMYTDEKRSSFFHFKFNNVWLLNILTGRFMQFLAFVPVDEGETRLYLRAYQRFCTLPPLKNLLGVLINFQNQYILNQDKKVVITQLPRSVMDADDEHLYPSDRGIAHFRSRWRELTGS